MFYFEKIIKYLSRWQFMDLDSLGEEARSILCLDAGGHNNLTALSPVYRGGNLPPGGQLEAVNGTDDLVKVPTSGGWVEDGELQLLVWANHKHSSGIHFMKRNVISIENSLM